MSMRTKSKYKLNEPFASLNPQEALRASLKASLEQNDELIDEMFRQLPKEVKDEVNAYWSLMFQKTILYNYYLVIRANLAISFYNIFLGNIFKSGTEYLEEFDTDIANEWFEQSNNIKKQIQEIDVEAKGVLKLEHFEAMADLADHFDFWLSLISKIGKDFGTLQKESTSEVTK